MRVSSAAISCAFLLCAQLVHSEPSLIAVTARDGQRVTIAVSDFDNKNLRFKYRVGKTKYELALADVARLEFAPFDSLPRAPVSDTLDRFEFRDGNMNKGVFRDLDEDEVFALMGVGRSEQRYKFTGLRSVDLSQIPLDVDRRIWGKGGFEFVNNMVETLISGQMVAAIEQELPLIEDEEVTKYLDLVGQRLAAISKRPDLPYEFKVVNQKTINAFTVGGGKVYVYRGLLERMSSEAELAGVLGHEIGHNVGKHTVRALYKQMLVGGLLSSAGELAHSGDAKSNESTDKLMSLLSGLLVSKYGRDDEREADYLGAYNLYQSGYDPHAMVGVFETLKKTEAKDQSLLEAFLASHPSAEERIENVSSELQRMDSSHGLVDTPAFQKMQLRLSAIPRPIGRLPVLSDTVAVAGMAKRSYSFMVEDTSLVRPLLKGSFRAYGGTGNDIRVLVMPEMDYLNFSNGHPAKALYDSGRLTAATVNLPLPGLGKYYVVFDNTFSLMTPKQVDSQLFFEYEQ